MSTLMQAADTYGIPWTLLAAIGVRESGFANKSEGDGGNAVGVFQIDLKQNPSVTGAQAGNLAWAASWAASTLAQNGTYIAARWTNAAVRYVYVDDGRILEYWSERASE
jgi:hypothetical protein